MYNHKPNEIHHRELYKSYIYLMDFFTKIDIPESKFKIDYNSKIAFLGSCFADNISKRFTERKFHTFVNPFGVIYNPLSIENMVHKIANANERHASYTEKDIFYDGESWSSWDAHGSMSVKGSEQDTTARAECIKNLNDAIIKSHLFLSNANAAFITLGTAYVYFLKETGKVVSNCLKQDASLFERRLISVEEAAQALRSIVKKIQEIKSDIHVIFTVSPLRHLNDGAHGNNLSKSTLLLAIEKIQQEFRSVTYFPSYEIVMDELRDYRFYAEDMTHLSATAEDYIFERMQETYCNDTTIAHIKYVKKFMKGAMHRIENADSPRTAEFARQQIAKAENLEHVIDGLDLSEEKEHFKKMFYI